MAEIGHIQELRDAASSVFDANDPIVQALNIRLKKHRIADEYKERRNQGEEKKDLIYDLSRKYYYSEKSIRNIVYSY